MRLLKTGPFVTGQLSILELHNFRGHQGERYAVLSHTWRSPQDEVLYADLLDACDADVRRKDGFISVNLDNHASLKSMPGWAKLAFALEQADSEGKDWLWVDTACIDRSSSAELAESINSVHAWFRDSAICYVYLADTPLAEWRETAEGVPLTLRSRWFTRGWTLSELIAPGHVVFYSSEWSRLGDKHELSGLITAATGIDGPILEGYRLPDEECVAKRMSWAAKRETSLPEDRAYCLMGLFGVSMPIIYGEGDRAFRRLQEEIIRSTDDHTIFAWGISEHADQIHGLLAASPRAFEGSGIYTPHTCEEIPAFEMSNRGLRISLHLTHDKGDEYIAALSCPNPLSKSGYIGIYLRKLGDKQYGRIRCNEITTLESRGALEQIFVRQSFPRKSFPSIRSTPSIQTLSIKDGLISSSADDTISPDGKASSSKYPSSIPSQNDSLFSTHLFHISRLRTWGRYEILDVSFRPPKCLPKEFPDLYDDLKHPPNILPQLSITFKMVKEAHRITSAILIGREDDKKRVTVLLGSDSEGEPGFDIVEVNDLSALKECKKPFEPMPFGTTAFCKDHRVTLNADTIVKGDVKLHQVTINIGGLGKSMDYSESLGRMSKRNSSHSRMSSIVQKITGRPASVGSK